MDLKDKTKKLLKSKYFYLMSNDALYVELFGAPFKRSNLENVTLVFSAITAAIMVLNYLETNWRPVIESE